MTKFCGQCGELIEPNSKFCANCGESIVEVSQNQSNFNKADYSNPTNEQSQKKKKGPLKILIIIVIVLLVLIGLFVGATIFLFSEWDADLDTSDFAGYYSGELWITDITMEGEEDISELMDTVKGIRMPMLVEIQEDETYEGRFVVKNPDTLEDARIFTFGGEYDQILGDTQLEGGEALFMQGIVEMDQEPFKIEGYVDLANNELMEITAEYHIEKVNNLVPIDSFEAELAFNEAMNTYFNKLLTDEFEDMDLDDPSLIENNDVESSILEENPNENLISDDILPHVEDSTVKGTWTLWDGYGEAFIIFDEGEYYDPYSEWTYSWKNEGYALLYLDEDVIVVPYEVQANMLIIDFETYGNESEYYLKHNGTSYQLIFNTFDQYGDVDNTKVEIVEKDIPGNMAKELILVIEAEINESNKTLDGKFHVDFMNGNVIDSELTGSKIQ